MAYRCFPIQESQTQYTKLLAITCEREWERKISLDMQVGLVIAREMKRRAANGEARNVSAQRR